MRIYLLLLAALLARPCWAQPHGNHGCRDTQSTCQGQTADPKGCDTGISNLQFPLAALRDPVPVRWVCPQGTRSNYYYGYGGYGTSYDYYDTTGGFNGSADGLSGTTSLPPRSVRRDPAPPDPRSRDTAFVRGTLERHVAAHSVAGKFFLKDPAAGKNWLLAYAGPASFQPRSDGGYVAWVPFRGVLGKDSAVHRVELNFHFRQIGPDAFEVDRVLIVRVNGHERSAAYRD